MYHYEIDDSYLIENEILHAKEQAIARNSVVHITLNKIDLYITRNSDINRCISLYNQLKTEQLKQNTK